ncbi:MAG: DUF1934 domain-containing protein [Oscillospiraceae bacterium]|nr:DUF1934 domain-containing protein [Oscillospiraceae bacterium]
MIEKNVIISVRGEQYYDDIDPDLLELTTEGRMTILDDGEIILEYQETELTGMEGTTTRFSIRGDRVCLTRTGSVNSEMHFHTSHPHMSLYETPMGALTIEITTQKLAHRLSEHGGLLDIRYTIAVQQQVTGRNQFKIRVRESMR